VRPSGRKDALAHRQEGRSAGGVTGGEHGAEMDVTRYTYNPLNPYQGPREASERADLLLPGLGGKPTATRPRCWASINHGWQYRSPPAGYFLSRRRSVQRTCNSHRRSRGQTVMDGQSSRTLARQSVSLAEFPSWQRLSPICPQRRARHARRAAGFWLPARSPEQQVRPAPIWGSRGRRFKSCQPDRKGLTAETQVTPIFMPLGRVHVHHVVVTGRSRICRCPDLDGRSHLLDPRTGGRRRGTPLHVRPARR